ncbi:retinol dehydrogenase 11 [Nematostella vectensis]|uniref:retinol dehydrogenase 11 n=1 Tax=Nematostella vectensis TaxID=45351 RepID=UPI00138FAFD5|nr:retinol dehydrogenase 11 [Nematostella vectensis]
MAVFRGVTTFVVLLAVAVYFGKDHITRYVQGGVCKSTIRLDGKTVVVTGANTGIGKETALDLAARGARVIMACRNLDKGKAALREIQERTGSQKVVLEYLDLASLRSVREFAKRVTEKESRLDVLINNAGVMWCPFSRTEDGFEMQFGVNHLGHFLLTNLLLDLLKKSAPSRIVTVSSLAHILVSGISDEWNEESMYNRMYSYSYSKLANVLFTRELANRLEGTGVNAYVLHPGSIRTELQRDVPLFDFIFDMLDYFKVMPMMFKSVRQGAQTTICCAVSEEHAHETGLYYSDCAVKEPSKAAQDDEAAKRLWKKSLELVKLA